MAADNPLVIATGNAGKVKEFQALLAPGGFRLLTPREVGFTDEVAETGSTFAANALLKSMALSLHTGLPVLADDSGLEVAALNGAPGVYSARYATADAGAAAGSQDAANRAKLLREMAGKENRSARFVCVLCHIRPGEDPEFFEGWCEGEIATAERGSGGFGYDPLIIPRGFDRTFAELPADLKDSLSHRGRAAALFLSSLGRISTQ